MKKYLFIALLFLCPCVNGQTISVPVVYQEQDQWCWAGCTKCILNYFKYTVNQCDIADYTRTVSTWHSYGAVNCCTDPGVGCNYWNYMYGCTGSLEDILMHFDAITTHHQGALTISEMQTEATNKKPTVFHWSWYSGGGHFVVGSGADAGGNVHYMNPWFGEGAHVSTYSWMLDDGSHTYDITTLLDVCPSINPGTISGPSTVCNGAKITLTNPVSGGVWSSATGRTTISGGVVTAIAGGVDTVKYTFTNPCGSFSATKIITINPDPGTIVGSNTVCFTRPITLTDVVAGGTWSTSKGKATVTATGVVTAVTAGTDTVFYSVTGACGISKAIHPVEVKDCHLAVSQELSASKELKVYPNPANGSFTLLLITENSRPIHVTINNVLGTKIMEFDASTNKETEVNFDQPAGIYIVAATVGQDRYVTKLLVSH